MNKQALSNRNVKTNEEVIEYINQVFKSFDCEFEEIILNDGKNNFIYEEGYLIGIEKMHIYIISNHSTENYKRILDTMDYIEADDQIEIGVINICF